MFVGQDLDFNNVSKVLNLPAATATGHPVTFEQMNAALEGRAWKDDVRVSTQGNIDLASPGAAIDGVTMVANDRFLVRSQTDDAENGVYVWNGAAVPATRSADASTFTELESAIVTVNEGTDAGATFRQTQVNGTLGTDDVLWTSFNAGAPAASESTSGIAEIATQAETDTGTDDLRFVTPLKLATWSGRSRRFEANIGDGAATQYDVTHNFNSRDVGVTVYRNGTPWDDVVCDVERPSVNAVRLRFSAAPTSNQFRVLVKL
jgi:hypothetical protein